MNMDQIRALSARWARAGDPPGWTYAGNPDGTRRAPDLPDQFKPSRSEYVANAALQRRIAI